MEYLSKIEARLNQLFRVKELGKDPAFSRFIPSVYDSAGYDWKSGFNGEFNKYFNGLMIKGYDQVDQVFLAVFPTDDVLKRFIDQSQEGDLLFMHHPLLMECGDPRGQWGRGFVPIDEKWLRMMKEKKLSVYTCHAPMDLHRNLGTSAAIAKELNAVRIDDFFEGCGIICEIQETDTLTLINRLLSVFEIPYADFEGKEHHSIRKIAIVAGCGDKVRAMMEAEAKGAQAYITGEIHCHIDNDYGRSRFKQIMDYVPHTTMSLIGVSHSASEYLVKKTLMKNWFKSHFDVSCILLPQHKWWL
ncbi:Nif3-like dinuclear metal center hexameric protein [Paenactinomyces guangxiensis]|uniref:GTP cyclohydrolase 1 type 2 homolog n=1 Tax=Paenactinomyces guangxiensis TaxID=1490290 RepID=A0A7W2A7E5_9BACL|nr:Nif3-like dinuclear metal center hexameric protein [Paenactinomyces guangxiensis]MBA4494461.1 Nif3-like dinuclear metal center hexameric protein [Paenactinomyces guangxiensis]MBH8591484.1 Nif3-like dinuclear metal center hexameric protein [Paenactinomyces guangxiensis]